MYRNVAAKIALFVFDTTTGLPKTGDAANLTAYVSKDFGTVTVLADTSATEMDSTNAKGWYLFDLAQGETDAVSLLYTGKSTTANMSVVGRTIETLAGDVFARLGAPAGASVSADIAAVKVDTAAVKVKTDFLPSATAGAAGGVFIAGSNAATSITTALTANVIGNVTGNLSGSVGSVTGAVGSVTGNVGGNVTGSVGSLATQAKADVNAEADAAILDAGLVASIDALPTNAELATALGTADDAVLAQVALVKAVTDKVNTTMESTGSPTDYVFTARALAQAPSGTGASAIAIADEVQTRTIAGVTLVATTTNLTNAPTNGDLTAAMKTSVTTAATAATPIAASVTGAVGSVTGNVGGNVAGSVGSVTGLGASDVGAIKAVTDRVNTTLESTGSPTDYVFTTRALAQAPSGGSAPSAAVIADAVWDEAIAGHLAAGSTGLALNDATAAGNPWNATLEGSLTASDLLRVTAAVAVGKDTITAPGNGTAVVVFRDASDLSDIVTANLTGSRRTAVTLTP